MIVVIVKDGKKMGKEFEWVIGSICVTVPERNDVIFTDKMANQIDRLSVGQEIDLGGGYFLKRES